MTLFSLLEVALVILITALSSNAICANQISDSEEYPCGIRQKLKFDIITNGWNAERGAYPWHAGIHHYTEGSHIYKCGGTLISRYFVINAAHCVESSNCRMLNPSVITVHLGKTNLRNDEDFKIYNVLNIIKHPEYSPQKNNIALLQLTSKVEFNEFVLPICLNQSKIDDSIEDIQGTNGIVIGWIRTENEPNLKVATMEVFDYSTCVTRDPLLYGNIFSRSMYCAVHINGIRVCNEDQGGGMFIENNNRWYLRGIGSFGPSHPYGVSCVYTNLQYFLPWIRSIVGDDIRPRSPPTRHFCTKFTEYYDCQFQNVHLKNGTFSDFGLERNPQQNLTFKDSTLEYLPKSLVDAFPNVTLLNLNELMITSIEPNAFQRAANLRKIYLENNRLINVDHGAFRGVKKLHMLVLSKNEITSFDGHALDSNTDLQHLFLDQNQLDTLPSFTNNAQLQYLKASHNRLASINDNHFRNQRNLKTLDLSFNQLHRLNLQSLNSYLELVDVSSNALTDFIMPTNVTHLIARNNSLTKFIVDQQCTLVKLNLTQNKLETQPMLVNCRSLEYLDLSYNLLEAFEFRRSMAKLKILNLRHNNLFDINVPINLQKTSSPLSLKALDLSYNQLSKGPSLNAFKKLQVVFLNDNYLISLKSYADESHTNFKAYRMANNEWSCAEIPKFHNWTEDKDNDYCKPEIMNVSGICCRDYLKPYSDRFNEILREVDFHKRANKNKCSKPVSTNSIQINRDEIHNAIANVNTVKADKLKEIKEVRIQTCNKETQLKKLQTDLNRLHSSKRNVALEIEKQRKSQRVTREELINEREMLDRIVKFVEEKQSFNKDLLSLHQNETENSNRLLDEKQQKIKELKENIENLQTTHTALKKEEKDKKKEKDQLQRKVNKNSETIHGGC